MQAHCLSDCAWSRLTVTVKSIGVVIRGHQTIMSEFCDDSQLGLAYKSRAVGNVKYAAISCAIYAVAV